MKRFSDELIGICRTFGLFERELICCGTVSVPQCVVLQALLQESREISDLAALTGVAVSSMTRLIDGLEKRNWVQRIRDDDDRRRVVVELTSEGRKEAKRLRDLTAETMKSVWERIPAAKRNSVVDALAHLRRAIAEVGPECCWPPAKQ
jgi:DNA-binding MarR family transcriptional regulator